MFNMINPLTLFIHEDEEQSFTPFWSRNVTSSNFFSSRQHITLNHFSIRFNHASASIGSVVPSNAVAPSAFNLSIPYFFSGSTCTTPTLVANLCAILVNICFSIFTYAWGLLDSPSETPFESPVACEVLASACLPHLFLWGMVHIIYHSINIL